MVPFYDIDSKTLMETYKKAASCMDAHIKQRNYKTVTLLCESKSSIWENKQTKNTSTYQLIHRSCRRENLRV